MLGLKATCRGVRQGDLIMLDIKPLELDPGGKQMPRSQSPSGMRPLKLSSAWSETL
jgi:hypothetical protein